jgi:hypothetical protein
VVAAVHVGADVTERVTDVQPVRRRVGEHIQQIELWSIAEADAAGKGSDRIRGLERALGLPAMLPATLQLGCEHRGIAVRRGTADFRGYHPGQPTGRSAIVGPGQASVCDVPTGSRPPRNADERSPAAQLTVPQGRRLRYEETDVRTSDFTVSGPCLGTRRTRSAVSFPRVSWLYLGDSHR